MTSCNALRSLQNMSQPFRTLPATALSSPTSFTASTSDARLKEFRQLLELARVGPTTYEGTRQDRRYGITTEWLKESKEQWLKFDWYETFIAFKLSSRHAGGQLKPRSTPFPTITCQLRTLARTSTYTLLHYSPNGKTPFRF